MSFFKSGIELPNLAGFRGCMVLTGLLLAGCTVSQQQVQDAALSQMTVPAMVSTAKKALDDGRYVEAAHWYQLATQRSDDEELVKEATQADYDHEQWQAALYSAQRWLQINPTSQDAHEIAALSALRLYQLDPAVMHLDALLSSAYITPASGFLQLLPKLEQADTSAALAVLQELCDKYPQVAEAHYAVAKLAAQTSNQPLMLQQAQRAHELSPYWSPAGMLLARAQLAGGNTDAALATGKSVIDNDKTPATRVEYAELLFEAEHVDEALQLLKDIEKDDGDASAAVLFLAQVDLQTGAYQSAFDRYSQLMSAGSHVSEAIFGMAQIAERAGSIDNARQLYSRVESGEYAVPAQIRLAQLIQQQDGIDAALASLKQYGEGNPDKNIDMIRAEADLLSASGDDKGALALYDKAVTAYPDDAPLRLARSFLLVKLNKISEAVKEMRALLAIRPEDPVVLNALGYTLVDRTGDVREGRELIQHALQYSPDSGAVLDSMGWAEFKLGHASVALDYLQRAVKRIIDADLDYHLGEVLWSLKRHDDAMQAWQVGLTHSPKNPQLLKRIQQAEKQRKTPGKMPDKVRDAPAK
ncbi:MAG TPA: tetratricopeptide repeat protein [Steroidobacteraceae bacterium]|nr:tetratricopeptide repeat protein [Steroidobacteraceae bacterium]